MEEKEIHKFETNDQPADYYFENGMMVFTESYHLKRGYCCKNGCRHCPYDYKKESNSKLERR